MTLGPALACAGAQHGAEVQDVDAGHDAGVDAGPPDAGIDQGPRDAGPPPLPLPAAGPDLALGGETTCALTEGRVRCWGSNRFGQLGDPSMAMGASERRARPTAVAGLTEPLRITAGTFHVCALETGGTVRCWGHGGWGQLGDGATEDRQSPVVVEALERAVAVDAGQSHTCALRDDGSVHCWGRNHMGQLGDGTTEDHATPTRVAAVERGVALAVGGNHTCVLREDGAVLCWGENLEGQLGDGTRSEPRGFRSEPAAVAELPPADRLWSGWAHVCARTAEAVRCWGRNDSMQLGARGRGSANDALVTPFVMEGAAGAETMALGARFGCALLPPLPTDGGVGRPRLRCVGLDHRGQLGNGSRRQRRELTEVALEETPVVLGAGVQHTCAIDLSGGIWCWGDDRADQVGGGRHRLVAEPHRVE